MPQTVRKFWGPNNGRLYLNYNWDQINQNLLSSSRYPEYAGPDQDEYRFIGEASLSVYNIAPHGPPSAQDQGVSFYVNIDWPTPLYFVTDITVLDNTPSGNNLQYYNPTS